MLSKGVPMRKRLLALALLTTLACALAPSVTFADERGATPIPVTIEVGDDGAPVSTSSFSVCPGSRKCTCPSTKPGETVSPAASQHSQSGGGWSRSDTAAITPSSPISTSRGASVPV